MEYKYHKAAILLGITTPTWQRSGACALCFGGGLRKEAKMSTNGALKRGRYGTVRTLAIKRVSRICAYLYTKVLYNQFPFCCLSTFTRINVSLSLC